MTGSQLRYWRTSHDLTLRQLADQLGNVVHFSTITGWETAEDGSKDIPEWAAEKILSSTQIKLPLDELHQLIDIAREDNTPAQEVFATALRQYIQKHTQAQSTKHQKQGTAEPAIRESSIEAAASQGRSEIAHPLHGIKDWPQHDAQEALWAALGEEGYNVKHHPDPDPGHPASGPYTTVAW